MASANIEHLIFSGIDEVRDTKPGGSGDDMMAANLNGADPQRRVGSSLLVHVMAGDKVAMSVNTLYNNGYRADEDQPIPADQALDAIIGTLAGGVGAIPGEGHNVKLVKDVFNSSNYTVFNDLLNTTTDPSKPKAYLNYVLFDENMKIVNSMTGAFQANGDNNWSVIGTTTAMEVPLNGYLAVYLSNNSSSRVNCLACTDVFFDDLRFTVTKGSLLEETHYYPFGLPMVAISSVTADGFIENRHKYQGNDLIKDLQLNLMDFQARQYDPQIGRFLSIDPMAASGGQDMFSPYAAMGNTPESNTDPNGLMPVDKTRFANQSRTWDFIQADGTPGGGAGSASGQGRDAWADGGFGRDSYGALSGFGNGMDAGVARWANTLAIKSLVSFVNSILRVGGTQNYSLNTETGQGNFWGGNSNQGVGAADPDPQIGTNSNSTLTLNGTVELSNIIPVRQSGPNDCVYANFEMLDAKYGGNRTANQIKGIATAFLFAGPTGPSAQQIPYLAAILGFQSNIIWDDGSAIGPQNVRNVWTALRNDRAVMMVAPNNSGQFHDRTIVRMEYWMDRSSTSPSDREYRTFVMDPAPGTIYQLPPDAFQRSILLYEIYK